MYLRGSEARVNESQLAQFRNYVELIGKPQRTDIVEPQNTAMESPKPKKTTRKRKKAVKRGNKS